MSTVFTKIIQGDIPSYRLAEDEQFFSFLDINPLSKGHSLVIPKKEVDYFFDLEEDVLADMMPFCKKVARAIEQTVDCERIGVSVVGLEVPHAHVHLIPIRSIDDMNFSTPRVELSEEEFEALAREIRSKLA